MNFSHLRVQLVQLHALMPTPAQLPPGFADPVTLHLRGLIASGEPSATPTTPEARAEAEALVSVWLARGAVRA